MGKKDVEPLYLAHDELITIFGLGLGRTVSEFIEHNYGLFVQVRLEDDSLKTYISYEKRYQNSIIKIVYEFYQSSL